MSVASTLALGGVGAIPGVGNMFKNLLHPEDAYNDAAKVSQQYYVDAQGRLQPIVNQGQSQYNRLNGQADALNDPVALQDKWAASYQTSPQAQQALDQAKATGLDSAASQGLLGSSASLVNAQKSAANISQNDRQNYLNDLMNKYMASIGIGQNLYGAGANAAGAQATNAMNEGNTLGGLKYGASAAPGQFLQNILGQVTKAGINYATGGVSGAGAA